MQLFPQGEMKDSGWEGLERALSFDQSSMNKEAKKKKKKSPDTKDIAQSDSDFVKKTLQSQFPSLYQIWVKGSWGKEILIDVLKALSKENIWNVKRLLDAAEKM